MFDHALMVAPLLVMVVIGFIAQRFYHLQSRTLAMLAVYILSPAVVLLGIVGENISLSILYLPLMVLAISIIICAVSYFVAGFIWHDARHQMVGFSSGTANSSYFGIPVSAAILGPESVPVAVMFALGHTLFEATVGYYLAARGQGSVKQSLGRLIKLPMLYALTFALILRAQSWVLPPVALESLQLLESAFTPIGMMLIGVSLAESKILSRPDFNFMGVVLFAKFVLWLGCIVAFITLDQQVLHIFNPLIYQVMLLQAVAPIAVSTVAYASEFKLFPEKMAMAVVISVFLAVPMISFVVAYFPIFP